MVQLPISIFVGMTVSKISLALVSSFALRVARDLTVMVASSDTISSMVDGPPILQREKSSSPRFSGKRSMIR